MPVLRHFFKKSNRPHGGTNRVRSLVAFHLDNLPQINQRYGSAATDLILKEFADRLRNASRGRDFGARLASDNFLLVLPGCSLRDAKLVSDRLGVLAVKFARHDIALTYSIGWVDYKPGDIPSDLIKRAEDVIQLYEQANEGGFSALSKISSTAPTQTHQRTP